jgi:hypothetical protein
MGLLDSTYRWRPWRRRPDLSTVPFEELQNYYSGDPKGAYEEFIRRLRQLVFYAAEEYLTRAGSASASDEVENRVMEIFAEFSPEFNSGEPQMILARFAKVIRRLLDEDAFRVIARHFYTQLPLYHLSDAQERRFLAASYEGALSKTESSLAETIAKRFDVTPDEVRKSLPKANQNLAKVIEREFGADELQEISEGYLP